MSKSSAIRRFLAFLALLLFTISANAQDHSIPYTQTDRDRMVRVETRIESMQSQINRLEDKFDSYFIWGFGLVLMSIFSLIGFINYDRRTTLAPVENKTERIIKVLKDAAEKDPALREALKKQLFGNRS